MTLPGQPPQRRRRRPVQARSRATVDFVLEAAARVFKREGFAATTNRIAEAAGVSIGTLYEYFPHKQALLRALAERHVELAETELQAACSVGESCDNDSLPQQAILHRQRFPSQALSLLADEEASAQALRQRARQLQGRLIDHPTALAAPQPGCQPAGPRCLRCAWRAECEDPVRAGPPRATSAARCSPRYGRPGAASGG